MATRPKTHRFDSSLRTQAATLLFLATIILVFASGCKPATTTNSAAVVSPAAVPTELHGKKIKSVFTAKVVGVVDGDTIDVLTSDQRQIRVRFDSIDTPEKGQPFGNAAKQELSKLAFGKTVTVYESGKHFERMIAFVDDFNIQMVQSGYAWESDDYSKSKTLGPAEERARTAHLGLWAAEAEPIPPWEWRKGRRE